MIVRTSSKFRQAYRKLSRHLKEKAIEKESIFRSNPFDSRLDTHKLRGKYKNYWSFSVSGDYRVMFFFADKNTIDFVNIGTHKIYK